MFGVMHISTHFAWKKPNQSAKDSHDRHKDSLEQT